MSQAPRGTRDRTIRDYGTRKIFETNDHGTRASSHPKQLRETDFPTDPGAELRVLYDPVENELILRPPEE